MNCSTKRTRVACAGMHGCDAIAIREELVYAKVFAPGIPVTTTVHAGRESQTDALMGTLANAPRLLAYHDSARIFPRPCMVDAWRWPRWPARWERTPKPIAGGRMPSRSVPRSFRGFMLLRTLRSTTLTRKTVLWAF